VMKASGDLSELLQHEIDHVNGILATDRAVDKRSFAMRNVVKSATGGRGDGATGRFKLSMSPRRPVAPSPRRLCLSVPPLLYSSSLVRIYRKPRKHS
jgi:hypothetical protein